MTIENIVELTRDGLVIRQRIEQAMAQAGAGPVIEQYELAANINDCKAQMTTQADEGGGSTTVDDTGGGSTTVDDTGGGPSGSCCSPVNVVGPIILLCPQDWLKNVDLTKVLTVKPEVKP